MRHGFWTALGFLTRLPVPDTPYNDDIVRASLRWYPVVGLLLGGLVAAASALAQWIFAGSPLLVGVITVATWVALTGGLHLDGFADTVDAWMGGLGDRKRSLSIMKDPHVGAAAVMWLCLFLLAKVAAVVSLLGQPHGFAALILACAWARLTPLWLFHLTPYVRSQGLGSAMQNALGRSTLVAMTVGLGALSLWLLPPLAAIAGMVAVATLFLSLRGWMLQRLGGMTGDTAGATLEVAELGFLLTLTGLAT